MKHVLFYLFKLVEVEFFFIIIIFILPVKSLFKVLLSLQSNPRDHSFPQSGWSILSSLTSALSSEDLRSDRVNATSPPFFFFGSDGNKKAISEKVITGRRIKTDISTDVKTTCFK